MTEDTGLTQTGAVMGTPSYMAPEQAAGSKEIVPAADIWALGAILYRLLTGRPPFQAATVMDTLHQVINTEPVAPSKLAPRLSRNLEIICLKCLRKEAGKRYRMAEEVEADLRHWRNGESIAARPEGSASRAWRWCRRNPRVAVLVAAVFVSVAIGGSLTSYKSWEALRNARGLRTQQIIVEAQYGTISERKRELEEEKRLLGEEKVKLRYQVSVSDVLQSQNDFDRRHVELARERLRRVPEAMRGWEWRHLDQRYRGGVRTLTGHSSWVIGSAVSPDGLRLATCDVQGFVRVWQSVTGQSLLTIESGSTAVQNVTFSPNGDLLAGACADRRVRVWDAHSGRVVHVSAQFDAYFSDLEFNPVNGRLVTCRTDGVIAGWRPSDFKEEWRFTIGSDALCVACSPDGKLIAAAANDGVVRVHHAADGRLATTIKAHGAQIWSMNFGPDSRRLATASGDRLAKVWDVTTGTELLVLRGHGSSIPDIAYSTDGRVIATASHDRTARLWDAKTGQELRQLKGHADALKTVTFLRDGVRLVTSGHDGAVMIWDAHSEHFAVSPQSPPFNAAAVAFGGNGERFATASSVKGVQLWESDSGAQHVTLDDAAGPAAAVSFRPDGRRLAAACADRKVRVWDADSGRLSALLTLDQPAGGVSWSCDGGLLAVSCGDRTTRVFDMRETGVSEHSGTDARHALVCPGALDDDWFVAGDDGTVRNVNLAAGTSRAHLPPTPVRVTGLAASCATDRLVTGDANGRVTLWRAGDGQRIVELSAHSDWISAAAFSADGKRFCTASRDGTAKVWDAADGRQLATFNSGDDELRDAAFSPDGSLVATVSRDGWIRLWNPATGAALRWFRGHEQVVNCVGFSPDGKLLATSSDDHSIKVWRVPSGVLLASLSGHEGPVTGLSFGPDSNRLTSASDDRAVAQWDVAARAAVEVRHGASPCRRLVLGKDGRSAVTVHRDGSVRAWRFGPAFFGTQPSETTAVAFSPSDGRRLAIGQADGSAEVLDLATGRTVARISGHTGRINSIAFDAGGLRLATGSDDRTACVWDAPTGLRRQQLRGSFGKVTGVAFSTDGRRLATSAATDVWGDAGDRSARIWDIETGVTLLELGDHVSGLNAVAFSADGTRLATAARDGAVTIRHARGERPETLPQSGAGSALRRGAHLKPAVAAEAAGDIHTLLFHAEFLLAHHPGRRENLLAARSRMAPDSLAAARAGFDTPSSDVGDRAWATVLAEATTGQRLALRVHAQNLLRDGRTSDGMALLWHARLFRGRGQPPVEELLLAEALLAVDRPRDAMHWFALAVAWMDGPVAWSPVARAVASGCVGPLQALTQLVSRDPDPRWSAVEWEAWHETDVVRRRLENRLFGGVSGFAQSAARKAVDAANGRIDPKRLDIEPKYLDELMAFARTASHQRRQFAQSAQLFEYLFREHPEWVSDRVGQSSRYFAACTAAMASVKDGPGAATDAAGREHWRVRSLEWLRGELFYMRRCLAARTRSPEAVRDTLTYWKRDGWLASVRGAAGLARLPAAEARDWTKFWSDVSRTLDDAKMSEGSNRSER